MEVGGDAPFALPSSSLLTSEQQKLIQSGHMTPFGTSELATPTTDSQQESGDGDVTQFSSESGPSSSAGLRLCSEGFDGLFETPTPSLSPRKIVRKKGQGSAELVGQKKRKGKEKKSADLADDGDGCDGASGEGVEEGEWMVTREEVEAMEREMFEETREESTDYTTDEELGAGTIVTASISPCFTCLIFVCTVNGQTLSYHVYNIICLHFSVCTQVLCNTYICTGMYV